MFKSKWNLALALLACALLLPATVTAKNQVTRPLKIQSDAIVTLNYSTFAVSITETGEASYLGRFSGEGTAFLDFDEDGIMFLHYFTDWTAANGDILHLEGAVYGVPGPDPAKALFTMQFWFIGGTGRFEGATGGFGDDSTVYSSDHVVNGSIATNSFSYRVTGNITY